MKIFGLVILTVTIICGTSFLTNKNPYLNWEIRNNTKDASSVSWAKFEWTNDTLDGKYYEKTGMNIPCRIEGIPNPVTFQFDLGADLTGIYENTLSCFHKTNPEISERIKRVRSPLLFWDKNKCFKDLTLIFGNYTATNTHGYVYKNYGDQVQIKDAKEVIHLGSIGADLFQNKVLIIDYPNQQFAICDNLPAAYATTFTDINLDISGKVILPMRIKDRSFKIMFDNGSSIFPIITLAKNINNYTTSPDIDTIQVSSWGQLHDVTGKLINDTFELAGQKFCNVKVYANHSGLGIDKNTDGMTGNALFWDKTIIIDFKNKKFGVK